MKKVGIIGGSGFIGSHTTKKFLDEGYQVKVSATDLSKTEKYNHLKKLHQAENLEIQELDVQDIQALAHFVNDCAIVVHGGTPFQLAVEDPKKELLDPTIEGTKNFLEVISKAPFIEQVVFVASVAAYNTNFPFPPTERDAEQTINEQDPPFTSEESHPYAQAKFMANQAVNNYVKEHPNSSFQITSVSPVFVVGPSLSKREDSTSSGLQFLFKNNMAPDPFVQMLYDQNVEFALVDVRDVADSIYRAATKTGINGKNYLLTSESYSVSDISLMLNHQDPEGKARLAYSNDMAKRDLGINFKPAQVPLDQYSE